MKMITGSLPISQRLGVSESTFMDMVFRERFPAVRNEDGVFEISETDLKKYVSNEKDPVASPRIPPEKVKAKDEADAQVEEKTETKKRRGRPSTK
jgi:hypothetical protein